MVKNLLKRLKKGKVKKEVKKKLSPESIEAMPEDIQKERGYQQGQIIALEEEIEELKEEIKAPREKQEVAKFLQQKSEEMNAEERIGVLGLRDLFDVLSKREKITGFPKEVKLYSQGKKRYFGNLYDISFNPDGSIGVWILDENKFPFELKRAPNTDKLFWDFEGLLNSVHHGIIEMAFDEGGTHIDNPYKEEVSQLIIDANGKYHWSHIDQRPVMAQLVTKERKINQLYKVIEMLERTLSKVGHEVNLSRLMAKMNDEGRKVAETLLVKNEKIYNERGKNWNQIEGELVEKSHQLSIMNKKVEVLEGVMEKMMNKIEKIQGDSNIDKAKKEILGDVDFVVGLLKGEKVTFAGTQEEVKEPLKREYDAYVEAGQQ